MQRDEQETPSSVTISHEQLTQAKHALDAARKHGDELRIALAEAALNDLLDRSAGVTPVTRNS